MATSNLLNNYLKAYLDPEQVSGLVTLSGMSNVITIGTSTTDYTLEINRNYTWTPSSSGTKTVRFQTYDRYVHGTSFLRLDLTNGGTPAFNNMTVFGKVKNGQVNTAIVEWWGNSATVYLNGAGGASVLGDQEYSYSVIAMMSSSIGIQDTVTEACGNYFDSGYTFNSQPVYTNGVYSIEYISNKWTILSGIPSGNNHQLTTPIDVVISSSVPITSDYTNGSVVQPYGTSMLPRIVEPIEVNVDYSVTNFQTGDGYHDAQFKQSDLKISKNGYLKSLKNGASEYSYSPIKNIVAAQSNSDFTAYLYTPTSNQPSTYYCYISGSYINRGLASGVISGATLKNAFGEITTDIPIVFHVQHTTYLPQCWNWTKSILVSGAPDKVNSNAGGGFGTDYSPVPNGVYTYTGWHNGYPTYTNQNSIVCGLVFGNYDSGWGIYYWPGGWPYYYGNGPEFGGGAVRYASTYAQYEDLQKRPTFTYTINRDAANYLELSTSSSATISYDPKVQRYYHGWSRYVVDSDDETISGRYTDCRSLISEDLDDIIGGGSLYADSPDYNGPNGYVLTLGNYFDSQIYGIYKSGDHNWPLYVKCDDYNGYRGAYKSTSDPNKYCYVYDAIYRIFSVPGAAILSKQYTATGSAGSTYTGTYKRVEGVTVDGTPIYTNGNKYLMSNNGGYSWGIYATSSLTSTKNLTESANTSGMFSPIGNYSSNGSGSTTLTISGSINDNFYFICTSGSPTYNANLASAYYVYFKEGDATYFEKEYSGVYTKLDNTYINYRNVYTNEYGKALFYSEYGTDVTKKHWTIADCPYSGYGDGIYDALIHQQYGSYQAPTGEFDIIVGYDTKAILSSVQYTGEVPETSSSGSGGSGSGSGSGESGNEPEQPSALSTSYIVSGSYGMNYTGTYTQNSSTKNNQPVYYNGSKSAYLYSLNSDGTRWAIGYNMMENMYQDYYTEIAASSGTFGPLGRFDSTDSSQYEGIGFVIGNTTDYSGVSTNANNSSLASAYMLSAYMVYDSTCSGTYTRQNNSYWRGFSVYKNANDKYLIAIDNNGYYWQIMDSLSEADAPRWAKDVNSVGTFGPSGSYVVVKSGSSMSMTMTEVSNGSGSGESGSGSTLVATGSTDYYNGTYTDTGNTNEGYPVYYNSTNGRYIFHKGSNWYMADSYPDFQMPDFSYSGADPTGTWSTAAAGATAPTITYGNSGSGSGNDGSSGDYIVTGAGNSAYNGTYNEYGTYNGYPTYKLTTGSRYIWYGYGKWYMNDEIGGSYQDYSYSGSTPAGSWTTEYYGTSPAPTVTAGSGSGSGSGSGNSSYTVEGGALMMQQGEGTYTLYSEDGGYDGTPVYSYVNGSSTRWFMNKAVDDDNNTFWKIYSGSSVSTSSSGLADGEAYVYSTSDTPPTGTWGNFGVTVTAN